MSALPKSVRDQVARAHELSKELYADDSDSASAEDQHEQQATQHEGGDPVSPAEPESGQEPEGGQAPAEPPADSQVSQPERTDWKQKYHVLQGKYDAEVPRLYADLRAANKVIEDLRQRANNAEAEVESLKARTPAGGQSGGSIEDQTDITKEEIEEFGPDLYDFIQRAAKQIADKRDVEREEEWNRRFQHVEQTASQTRSDVVKSEREKVFERLNERVPNWQDINVHKDFINWLALRDVYAGVPRKKLLTQAFERNDADAVVAFFESFLKENAAVSDTPDRGETASAQTNPNDSGQASGQAEPQANLDEYVAPGTPKTGPAGAQEGSGKRVWTRDEIRQLNARKNEFAKRGKPVPEELKKLERDMFAAQNEGRVQY